VFHTASEQEIKTGKITDQYFLRTLQILKAKGINKRVVAEVTLKGTPPDFRWGVLAGIEEAAFLLEGLPIDVFALPEGTVFAPGQPLVVLEGLYQDFCAYETALLGLLCQASGIASKASRCKKAAQGRVVLSFGVRRMHPAIAPMIERNAFIGGCDGVAVGKSAELIGEPARGTIPHALVLLIGDTAGAMAAFHEVIEPTVKRVALIDTFGDEKLEALKR
jgi:nicotinate phosphoribosyltransferase